MPNYPMHDRGDENPSRQEDRAFLFSGLPARAVFGRGSVEAHLEEELAGLDARRALVLATPRQEALAADVEAAAGGRCAAIFAGAVMHVPIESAKSGIDAARRAGADSLIAVGGGSATGLGKAIALETGLPLVAIPTTYSGSEMTPIFGITENGIKRTGRNAKVLPRVAIYDPDLTLELPLDISVTSGINAIAHAAEGLYAQDRNPLVDIMAKEAISAISGAIPRLRTDPRDPAARSDALYGAWLCGMILGDVGMALHHKLCHTLGGSFGLPHAEVHSVILPHAIAFNAKAAPQAMTSIADALRSKTAAGGLFDLASCNGAPVSLEEIGMKRSDLEAAASLAVSNPYWNPRPFGPDEKPEILELLQHAFDGERPSDGQ